MGVPGRPKGSDAGVAPGGVSSQNHKITKCQNLSHFSQKIYKLGRFKISRAHEKASRGPYWLQTDVQKSRTSPLQGSLSQFPLEDRPLGGPWPMNPPLRRFFWICVVDRSTGLGWRTRIAMDSFQTIPAAIQNPVHLKRTTVKQGTSWKIL